MRRFAIDLASSPEELRAGLREIMAQFPKRFAQGRGCKELRFEKNASGPARLAVAKARDLTVRYTRPIDAFRALGRLMGEASGAGSFSESPPFDTLGVMVDVSRNGVLLPGAFRALLRRLALMGINMAMLYTEDTYEIPGEPFFGYLRGRYTAEELKQLDDYASLFGIEMMPCIQTLAHLAQILQWPAFEKVRDTEQVLIAEEPATYALIEKMIRAASAPFRSKRIHIGMDEAAGIGSGRYKQLHGEKPAFEILNGHLARVRDICSSLGLKPMIWSDMYFRLGSKTHGYYDKECVIPPEVASRIPTGVQLVYWDYYHLDKDFYCDWIERHRALGSEPLVAGGIWTWNRFWAALPFSFTVTDACMAACREKGVREVFMTMWGDGGMECDVFSALPGLQRFAELAWTGAADAAAIRANFVGSCDADLDDWVRASGLDGVPDLKDPARSNSNASKWLLWQDPLLAYLDPNVDTRKLRAHYEAVARDLAAAARKGGEGARLAFPAALASALALKAPLRSDLAAAYAAGDRTRLRKAVGEDIPRLRKAVRTLWKRHRDLWFSLYKPFGWEVIDRRYGGLVARLDTVSERLRGFLSGKIESIPELEVKLERAFDLPPGELPNLPYSRVTSPSFIR